MALYTNQENLPLSMAVWLARDEYDHRDDPNHISATSLLKPIRQLVLAARVPQEDSIPDIAGLIQSRMGTALHNGVERAWLENYQQSLRDLGYSERVIQRIKVNPKPEELTRGDIPVYLEIRSEKQIEGFLVSGKFDFVGDGRVEDIKSTGVFTYMSNTNDEKYILQGSIYRWLNPGIITKDVMAIQFIFTDWSKLRAITEASKGYPEKRMVEKVLRLKSIPETEAFVRGKLIQIKHFKDLPEAELPECTEEELWRKPSEFKYYKNPQNTKRSTKNFATLREANQRLAEDGGVGIVIEKTGEVMACKFCPAFPVCTQKDRYIADGSLKL